MKTVERAEQIAKSVTGYAYNPNIMVAVIDAGYDAIADGTVLMQMGDQSLIKRGTDIICLKGDVETKRMPVGDKRDEMLAQYAVTASRISTQMGAM